MFFTRKQIWSIILISHVLLPLGLIIGTIIWQNTNLVTYCIYGILSLCFFVFIFRAGYWEFTRYRLRYSYLVVEIVALGLKIIIGQFNSAFTKGEKILCFILGLIAILLLIESIKAFMATRRPKESISLAFPVRGQNYIITDGGDGAISSIMNYHYKSSLHGNKSTNASMKYAVDIAKLNNQGKTVSSLLTQSNKDYVIYGEKVYAPISGTIVEMENDMEDNPPFPGNLKYSIGNHVVIQHENIYIVIGHFQPGSIKVVVGQEVQQGDEIALVGNSGLTPRAHIHMQASRCEDGDYWGAEGIPILFEGEVPYKNRLFTRLHHFTNNL